VNRCAGELPGLHATRSCHEPGRFFARARFVTVPAVTCYVAVRSQSHEKSEKKRLFARKCVQSAPGTWRSSQRRAPCIFTIPVVVPLLFRTQPTRVLHPLPPAWERNEVRVCHRPFVFLRSGPHHRSEDPLILTFSPIPAERGRRDQRRSPTPCAWWSSRRRAPRSAATRVNKPPTAVRRKSWLALHHGMWRDIKLLDTVQSNG